MDKKKSAPQGGHTQRQDKDTKYLTQEQRTFLSFQEYPKTMLQVSREIGIERGNICRYVGAFRKRDHVAVVRQGLCPITKFKAGFLTTNPALFPIGPTQPALFEEVGNE